MNLKEHLLQTPFTNSAQFGAYMVVTEFPEGLRVICPYDGEYG